MAGYGLYDGVTARFLGEFASEQAAWQAADAHSLAVLARAGEWVVVEHLVVTHDTGGRALVRSELTHIGPPEHLDGCARWLTHLPGGS